MTSILWPEASHLGLTCVFLVKYYFFRRKIDFFFGSLVLQKPKPNQTKQTIKPPNSIQIPPPRTPPPQTHKQIKKH
jgi:hypothetical protein